MPKITLSIIVNNNPENIFEGFNQSLFEALNPPFPKAKVLRFDGCKTNDEVHLAIDFIIFKFHWVSIITETKKTKAEIFFVDEGKVLPFFLKSWKHRHIIRLVNENKSEIIDDIFYTSGFILFDFLLYPSLYLQFLLRKPIYQKILGQL